MPIVIDATGMVVIPGLIHGHLHACQTLFRNRADVLGTRVDDMLRLPAPSGMPTEDFTVEAYVLLESLHNDASVRVIASQWDGKQTSPGWSLGVTSAAATVALDRGSSAPPWSAQIGRPQWTVAIATAIAARTAIGAKG